VDRWQYLKQVIPPQRNKDTKNNKILVPWCLRGKNKHARHKETKTLKTKNLSAFGPSWQKQACSPQRIKGTKKTLSLRAFVANPKQAIPATRNFLTKKLTKTLAT